jgi:hypothetical protein
MLIKDITAGTNNGWSRVEVIIAGKPLYFESKDTRLSIKAEAFASALLLSALKRNDKLQFEMPLSMQWLEGAQKLISIFNEWWNYPIIIPEGTGEHVATGSNSSGTGQCFTGGVDSFHTLIHNLPQVSHLVYVFGYDMPLHLKNRMFAVHSALREIAEYYGKKLIVIRTNLKEHPVFEDVNWEHAHGGALAAVGHLLNKEIGQLIIPSTFIYDEAKAWGSSDETDPLWSSECMQVIHYGAFLTRLQKVATIVNAPLVKKHLRVCWEMRRPLINCSECEKCIRTMLCITLWGSLKQFKGFDHSVPLVNRIDSLPFITPHVQPYYRDFNKELKSAIQKLLQRSPVLNQS